MDQTPLSQLLRLLPLHSEEDDIRETVTEAKLLEQLSASFGRPAAEATLTVVRSLLQALCLLDLRVLGQGVWTFSSFPAFLAAQSLLHTLATPGQRLCETDYWRTPGDVGNPRVEAQRKLLHQLETRRVQFHPTGRAEPVRYVYVAWGLIRIGGQFLLYHREDRTRPEVRNHVFPGGRFKPDDLEIEQQTPAILRNLHCSQSTTAIEALPRTLERELSEELGMRPGQHFSASLRLILDPYRHVEGTGNRHAYTEYVLALYDVSLSAEGETRLLDTVANAEGRLIWFSSEDLVAPLGRSDGKTAFIDALHQQFGTRLKSFFDATPTSSTLPYRFSARADAVELPVQSDEPILIGETGKERKRLVALSPEGHGLLVVAAAHARGIDVEADPEHLCLYPGGWLKLKSVHALTVMKELLATLEGERLPLIQSVYGDFARISVDPDILFFDERCFSYWIHQEKSTRGELALSFRFLGLPWAECVEGSVSVALVAHMIRSIEAIASGDVGPGGLEEYGYSDETLKKNVKEMLDEKTRSIGLRKLIRVACKRYQIGVKRGFP